MYTTPPRVQARVAALFYLLEGVLSAFGAVWVPVRLTASGNATATAANVLARQPLEWAAFAAILIAVLCHAVYTVLFYALLKPVNRTIALIAAVVSLVGAAIEACAAVFQIAPLLILRGGNYLDGGGGYLHAFPAGQRRALALLSLQLNAHAFDLYLFLFGFWLVLIAGLLARSGYIPRFVGVLAVLAGVSNLVHLVPPLANYLLPYYLIPDAIGEPLLLGWLLIAGVNVTQRNEPVNRRSLAGLHSREPG